MTLKIGDKVKLLYNVDLDDYVLKAGNTGEVVDVDEHNEYPYYVKFTGTVNDTRVFRECEIEKID